MEPLNSPSPEHLLTRSSIPIPEASRAPEILYVVVTCVEAFISGISLALLVFSSHSFSGSVLPSHEDRLYLLLA